MPRISSYTSPTSRRNESKGFTLIELTIVAVVLIIIAVIAVPILIRQRIAANESSAISSMRTISTAQAAFLNSKFRDDNDDGVGDYGTLVELSTPPVAGAAPFLDNVLGGGIKSGYLFDVEVFPGTDLEPDSRFSAFAFPGFYNRTGIRNFYIDQENVLRFTRGAAEAGSLGPGSPPVGG